MQRFMCWVFSTCGNKHGVIGSWSWRDDLACMAGSVTYRIDLALGKQIFCGKKSCVSMYIMYNISYLVS